MDIHEIDKMFTDIVNMVLVDNEGKMKLWKILMDSVATSCVEYSKNGQFKADIDTYIANRKIS